MTNIAYTYAEPKVKPIAKAQAKIAMVDFKLTKNTDRVNLQVGIGIDYVYDYDDLRTIRRMLAEFLTSHGESL